MKSLLVFVCIGNRNRSPFAEFFFSKLLRERDEKLVSRISTTSAGFVSQTTREKMAASRIGFPDPFFGRPLACATRAFLLKEGIAAPDSFRTKALTPELTKEAELIIVALPEQKQELVDLHPEAVAKICTIREISRWDGYLSWEDPEFQKIPTDVNFWDYVEENQDHVSITLSEMKMMLIMAYPAILDRFGLKVR